MKLQEGKFYRNGFGRRLGPAYIGDQVNNRFRLNDPSDCREWWFKEDGTFVGAKPGDKLHLISEDTDLVFAMERAVFAEHAGEAPKPASEKQIYEMELDDYRRGIDAIWHNRHLGV